ncbi:hypothetical protein [Pimelobacter simplex]|uniref:hypothetical protein n=1 Tax=Nocardioides simplex TaxID=2045 RepID=UPI003AB04FBC
MRRKAVILALIASLQCMAPAVADGGGPSGTSDDTFWAQVVKANQTTPTSGGHGQPSPAHSDTPQIVLGSSACGAAQQVVDAVSSTAAPVSFCPGTTPTPNQPTLTLTDIRHAFAELPLSRPTLVIQPPDGLTLVNLDTNFYTPDPRPLTRTVTLLGHQVTIRATPATFTWNYGDKTTRTTTDPGAPYPQLRITHRYERKGRYHPSLATTFTGTFRLDGAGPWRAIPGTVTLTSTPQAVRAIEAAPTLVGY